MTEATWEEDELECLGRCPVCGSKNRTMRFSGIEDRISETYGRWDYYQCLDCGVFYIDPRPTEKTIGRAYENYFTHTVFEERERMGRIDRMALGMRNDYLKWKYAYDKQPRIFGGRWLMYLLPPWLRLEWDHHARHLPKPTTGSNRLLDVGCGNGQFFLAAQSAGWACHGVDFDPKAVETACGRDIDVALGSLKEQQFPDEHFNAITLSHVVEHVHYPGELLKECARVLKSGGTLWVATPNIDSAIRKWFQRDWLGFQPPHHLILFNRRSLREVMEQIGLSIRFERRGTHIQRHWLGSQSLKQGKSGMQDVYLDAFTGSQTKFRYWVVELLAWLAPSLQGDVIIRATKK